MTMKLDCPLEGCHASIEGETEAEVMGQAADHAKDAHPELELDDETIESIRSKVQAA